MQELKQEEVEIIVGGLHLNIGMALAGIAGGFIMGGPVGALTAVGIAIASEGINNLSELPNKKR